MSREPLRKVLVAIDGSETGDYALNVATDIGEKYSSQIDILHIASLRSGVVTAPMYDPMIGPPAITPSVVNIPTSSDLKNLKSKEDSLLLERQKIVHSRNLPSDVISRTSEDISGEILRTASEGKYDLVVLGSRGLSGLKSLLLGSVSKKVAKDAKQSVLIVSTRISRLPKILLGYDGSEESKAALLVGLDLGKKFNAEVDPIGIVRLPISTEGYVISDMDRYELEMKQRIDEASSALKKEGVRSEGRILNSSDISKAIVEEAKRLSYDFIIVGSRSYGRLKSLFLGSVASGVANSAKTNVWIVR